MPSADVLEQPVPNETLQARMIRIAKALRILGVSGSQVQHLLTAYDLDVVEQQLRWLPYRKARRRSSLIVSAIRENYGQPADLTV